MRDNLEDRDFRKMRREVVVALIECEGDVVVVQNIQGQRRDWQLPGGRVEEDINPGVVVRQRLLSETGLQIPINKLRLVKSIPRETSQAQQIVYFYRLDLPVGGLRNMPSVSPDGHIVRREPRRTLNQLLNVADLQLITALT